MSEEPLSYEETQADGYPEPPRDAWTELALLSKADDPYDYEDKFGAVQDIEVFEKLRDRVIVPFDSYDAFPAEGPFDGAKAEAEDMNVVFRWDGDAGDWTPLNTGTDSEPIPGETHMEAVSVEDLNNTLFVHASEGAGAINSDLSDAAAQGKDGVHVYGNGTFSWSDTIEVPNNTTLSVANSVRVEVPESHNLTQYDEPEDSRINAYSLITNKDRTAATDVVIEGGEYNFSNVTEATDWGGVWLHNASDSEIRDVHVEDIIEADGGPSSDNRAHCLFLSFCDNCEIRDSYATLAGYDNVRVAASSNCKVVNTEVPDTGGGAGGTGWSLQVTAFGEGDDETPATNTTVRECTGNNRFGSHGAAESVDGLKIIDCETGQIQIFDNSRNVDIQGCTVGSDAAGVYLICTLSGPLENIGVNDVRFRDTDPCIGIVADSGETVQDINIGDITTAGGATFVNFETRTSASVVSDVDIDDSVFVGDGSGAYMTRTEAAGELYDIRVTGGSVTAGSVADADVEHVTFRGVDVDVDSFDETSLAGVDLGYLGGRSYSAGPGIFESFESFVPNDNDPVWQWDDNLQGAVPVTSEAIYGTQAVRLDSTDTTSGGALTTRTATLERGIEYIVWLKASATNEAYQIHYFASDRSTPHNGDAYLAVAHPSNGEIQVSRRDGGSFTNLDSTAHTFSSDTWYGVGFGKTFGGEVRTTLYDADMAELATASATDSNYNRGGLGIRILDGDSTTDLYLGAIMQRPFQ